MSLFGETGMTPGADSERPQAPVPPPPPTPWHRRAVVVLVVLAVALVLSVIEVNRAEHDAVPTQSTPAGEPWNDLGPTPEDIALTPVVAAGMREAQTDPAAWSHVTQVQVVLRNVWILVDTGSRAVLKRVCEQARRYLRSANDPEWRGLRIFTLRGGEGGLDDLNDACVVEVTQ